MEVDARMEDAADRPNVEAVPDMDGAHLSAAARSRSSSSKTPVVACAGMAQPIKLESDPNGTDMETEESLSGSYIVSGRVCVRE